MVRCPVCGSGAVVVVVSRNRRAFCTSCHAKWVQEASEQLHIRPRSLLERGVTIADDAERFAVDWA
jgi:transposase-like protein